MTSTRHLVLLGDSILDNAAYTGADPDVAAHLRTILPGDWRVTLCAVDGSTTGDVADQVARVPDDASDLVVSVGGNDGLLDLDVLAQAASSTGDALDAMRVRLERFADRYSEAIDAVVGRGLPVVVCTIYGGNFEPPLDGPVPVAVALYDDVILREATRRGLPVIDLRAVCDRPEHYANEIEPNGEGGRRIATAIAAALGVGDGPAPSSVWGRLGAD